MEWIKGFFAKLAGKQVGDGVGISKTKLTAIIYVIITAVQEISKAYGHPVEIPQIVFRFLEGAGLWSLRAAMPDAKVS